MYKVGVVLAVKVVRRLPFLKSLNSDKVMLLAAMFTHFLTFLWKPSKTSWLWSCYLSFSIYLFNENGGEHIFTVSVMHSGYS